MKDKKEFEVKKVESEIEDEVKKIESEIEDAVAEEKSKSVNKKAYVTDCVKLNVRENPDLLAKVISEIKLNDEVEIEDDEINGFVKVYTAFGNSGYCMKKYLNIIED